MPDGIETHLETDGVELLDRVRDGGQEPGRAARGAGDCARRSSAGCPCSASSSSRGASCQTASSPSPAPTARPRRSSCSAPSTARPAGPVEVAGNVGTPLASLVGRAPREATIVCEVLELPGRGRPGVRARGGAAAEPERGPPRPSRQPRRLPRGQAAGFRQPGARARGGGAAGDRHSRPGAAGHLRRGRPDLARSGGELRWGGEALIAERDVRLRGEHNLENAMGAAAVALADGVADRRSGVRAARVRGRAAPAGGGGERGRRALRERLEGHQRVVRGQGDRGLRRAGVHAILGGSLKGGGFAGCARPWPRAAAPST